MAKIIDYSQFFNFCLIFLLFFVHKNVLINSFSQPEVEPTGQNVCTFEEE
jgi:hypothetical protein